MTNTGGRRRTRKDRRNEPSLPSEYDFSVTGIGISVICVVVAVMFSV